MSYPQTPKELMISRYEAFKSHNWGYLQQTTTQKIPSDMDEFYKDIEWLKLEIVDASKNEVEFKAYYRHNNTLAILHERSSFVQKEGKWLYDDGVLFNTQIQRNEKCPCGSGKKFKKCCALSYK